jgi:hypothetical protein
MRNRSFEPLKTAMGILLAVFLVVSLTAASTGAVSSASPGKETGTKSISTAQFIEPNQYVLHGIGHKNKAVSIIYSTTSITGKPIFNYKDPRGTHSFTGDEIRTKKTEIGTMVTVTLESIPDFRVTTLTLLLPAINLDGTAQDFKTIAIRTTSKTTIGGPRLVKGSLQSYEVIDLKGTASSVAF